MTYKLIFAIAKLCQLQIGTSAYHAPNVQRDQNECQSKLAQCAEKEAKGGNEAAWAKALFNCVKDRK